MLDGLLAAVIFRAAQHHARLLAGAGTRCKLRSGVIAVEEDGRVRSASIAGATDL